MYKLKVMTVVGTRPEIIRLASTIKLLDKTTDHVLVHTGQNYDYELNEIFFEDLGISKPKYFLDADVSSLGTTLGSILAGTEKVISQEKPDAMLVLGDTNSCISAIIGKRMKVPVYHMEAGNRCFDENVPEETNRKIVDHVSDYNLVYSEHARRNLLAEGIHPSRIHLTGSPMKEVLKAVEQEIESSKILEELNLKKNGYILVSLHREENVDNDHRLRDSLVALNALRKKYSVPILVSTHPRTQIRLNNQTKKNKEELWFHQPFGFLDYNKLQQNALIVISDSGTISEESSILGFPAITLRDSIERPEAQDVGAIVLSKINSLDVLIATELVLTHWGDCREKIVPEVYQIQDTSWRVVSYIHSTARNHKANAGIRENTKRTT